MKKTVEFLDDAKKKLGDVSDYRLAKLLGIQQSTMSRYRNNERVIDDYAATQIANILEINEMLPISAANAEREKTSERREFWIKKYKQVENAQSGMSLPIVTYTLSLASLGLIMLCRLCILC